ncbi:MAG: PIN domain-containing protein [Candidatus Dormibacteria bacterium]
MLRLVELAVADERLLHVPAGVVAQVWRDGARQARLARLVGSTSLEVTPLDVAEAEATGALCGLTGTSDIVDASVALLARRLRATVVTSDPEDIQRLDPMLSVVSC